MNKWSQKKKQGKLKRTQKHSIVNVEKVEKVEHTLQIPLFPCYALYLLAPISLAE